MPSSLALPNCKPLSHVEAFRQGWGIGAHTAKELTELAHPPPTLQQLGKQRQRKCVGYLWGLVVNMNHDIIPQLHWANAATTHCGGDNPGVKRGRKLLQPAPDHPAASKGKTLQMEAAVGTQRQIRTLPTTLSSVQQAADILKVMSVTLLLPWAEPNHGHL